MIAATICRPNDASQPAEDDEHDGTEADNAYAEWTSLHGNIRRSAVIERKTADSWFAYVPEDAEDDDPGEDSDSDLCLAGDDGVFSGNAIYGGLGFATFDQRDSPYLFGADEDMERESPLTLNPDRDQT